MKRTLALGLSIICAAGMFTAPARTVTAGDTINAREAFLRMPASTLELLTSDMRRDMLGYLDRDSIYQVPNTLEGLSWLETPVTDSFLQVRLTPVSLFTIRVLPGGSQPVIATAYTVGDSLQARDTQLRFFTPEMREIKRDKVIRIASTEDFLDLHGVDRHERERLLYMVPYPTVEYTFSPDGTELTARLTAEAFMGSEAQQQLQKYLRKQLVYRWDGRHYKLEREK